MTQTSRWGQAYLDELERAAAVLPADRRVELLADVAAHLETDLASVSDEATARDVLARLGEPSRLVAEAAADLAPTPRGASAPGGAELVALLLMGIGGVVLPLLAPAVGVMIMGTSPRWATHHVRVAWAILGVGLAALLTGFALLAVTTQPTPGIVVAGLAALAVVVLVGPLAALYAASRPRT